MRLRGRELRADAVAARARPDHADVGEGRDLALRGRRQRAMAAGARQRRSPDHAAAVGGARGGAVLPATYFFQRPCRSAFGWIVFQLAGRCWRLRLNRSFSMRFMYIVTSPQPMTGPTPEMVAAIQKISEREIKAGRMVDNGGLMPLQTGARVQIAGGKLSVIDGPFVEAKEVIGGYAIFELRDKEEALAMAKEFMQLHLDHMPGWEGTCELRAFASPPH